MMKHEFEALAGYEVSTETYDNIIEPMYMATNLSKAEFVKTLNRKSFEQKKERKPLPMRMLVRDRGGYRMTPNGCWYHIQYVDLIDVDIKTGKYMVAPLSDEELAKIYKSGHSLDVSGYYDFDYTDCIDTKRKPIELKWGW
jgi:hypothetical protein